jgi:hypothetical protein
MFSVAYTRRSEARQIPAKHCNIRTPAANTPQEGFEEAIRKTIPQGGSADRRGWVATPSYSNGDAHSWCNNIRLICNSSVRVIAIKGERTTMKMKSFLLCLILAVFATGALAKSKSEVRDVTGCLAKGDSADEYLLTGDDASTWEVRSSKVALAKHVGHTVTATGVVTHSTMHNMKEDAKDAAKDSGMKKSDAEHGHMTITALKMVSDSCK